MTFFRCMKCGEEDAHCILEVGKRTEVIPTHCPYDGSTICDWKEEDEE